MNSLRSQDSQADQENHTIIDANRLGIKFVAGKRDDMKSIVFRNRGDKGEFWALKGVSFSCARGDIIGIIGSNGAGKSTLCSVISRLLRPDRGDIHVAGEVSALLSLGTGFRRELTGRENIYLNGMMLGFSKKHMETIYDEILEFSGLHAFIDQPIKHYSSGMRARLGFSIATILDPEILVLDEALSTGDAEFKRRAMKKTQELVKTAKVVIIVSHNINFIEANCTKALWIDKGVLKADGLPADVCAQYRQMAESHGTKPVPKKLRLKKTETVATDFPVIEATNLGVRYKVNGEDFWALKDCTFTVNEGDILGIIGHNGAGKSTLCKVLSGILRPDEGHVRTDGEISALLSFGSGFNKQLSGSDNIFLNGLMLGISKNELKYLYDQIVDFSGLGKFIDKPVKTYSSGMVSRLGFSIATMIEPDIFMIDEALAAGDMIFYEKASARIQEMINTAKAVLIVTHSMRFVKNVCTKVMWMKNGKIMHIGTPEESIALYEKDIDTAGKTKLRF